MSRSIFVRGFKDIETAKEIAVRLQEYHNVTRASDHPISHDILSYNEGGECGLIIPLFSQEPFFHAYDSLTDLTQILKNQGDGLEGKFKDNTLKVELQLPETLK